jgi:signal transduction histidine kinase
MPSRARILSLATISIIPLIVCSILAIRYNVAAHEARIFADQMNLAGTAAFSVSAYVDRTLATLAAVARNLSVQPPGSQENASAYLRQLLSDNQDWDAIALVDASGAILAGSADFETGVNLADRPFFQRTLTMGQATVSEPIVSRIRGVPALVLAVPVGYADGQRSVLVVPLSVSRLTDQLQAAGGEEGVELAVVDPGARAIAHPDPTVVGWLASFAPGAGSDAKEGLATHSLILTRSDGKEHLVAFAPVRPEGWGVFASRPASSAFAPMRSALVGQLGLLGLAVFIVVMMTGYLGTRLIHAHAELERTVDIRNAYFAATAHDLRSPLTTIRGAAQLQSRLLSDVAEQDARVLRPQMVLIDAATGRLARLASELLDLARLEAGRPLNLERSTVDLVELTRQIVAEAQPSAESQPIVFTADQPVTGSWDADRLERVIANLLDNALRYGRSGAMNGDHRIEVHLTRVEQAGRNIAVLTVRDYGLGIPAEDLPHVFDRFRRGTNVAGQISGTGLGLAGAKQIVEQHGGAIRINSELGKGTMVRVELPT